MKNLDKMIITDEAREVMKEIEEQGCYARLSLSKSGCCSYKVDVYPDKALGKDTITEVNGVHMIIDPKVEPFIGSIKINFGKYGIGRKKLYVKMQ